MKIQEYLIIIVACLQVGVLIRTKLTFVFFTLIKLKRLFAFEKEA